MPQPEWLMHSRNFLFTVGGWKPTVRAPAWSRPGEGPVPGFQSVGAFSLCPHRVEGTSELSGLFLKGTDPIQTPAPVMTRSGDMDSSRCRTPGKWALRMGLEEGQAMKMVWGPHGITATTFTQPQDQANTNTPTYRFLLPHSQLVPLWHFDTNSLIFSLNTSPLFSTTFQCQIWLLLTYVFDIHP